jgi:hypothetical protein
MISTTTTIFFWTVAFALGTLWALWILYIAMMNVKRVTATKPLVWQTKILVYPTMVVFEVIEFIANVIVLTVLFFDWPKEIRVSNRLRRYHRRPARYGWRLHVVKFIKPMLDPFDPAGPHI